MPPRPKKPWPFRIEYPPELPISSRADEIIAAIQNHQVLILAGETGSGKTTQIPKMCLVAGRGEHGRIACTQPRRVAATSVARRVAEELNVTFGREVGCKIRFADQTSGDTAIKFMTDGMLLAELQADPELRDYDTIIVDEAHERSLNIDFILGHLRRLRRQRPDLKIVITSATIDTEAFSKAFDGAPIIEVSGRVYPVEVIYAPLEEMKEEGRAGTPLPAERRGSDFAKASTDKTESAPYLSAPREIWMSVPLRPGPAWRVPPWRRRISRARKTESRPWLGVAPATGRGRMPSSSRRLPSMVMTAWRWAPSPTARRVRMRCCRPSSGRLAEMA